jgi:hypothetical protein
MLIRPCFDGILPWLLLLVIRDMADPPKWDLSINWDFGEPPASRFVLILIPTGIPRTRHVLPRQRSDLASLELDQLACPFIIQRTIPEWKTTRNSKLLIKCLCLFQC